MAKHRFFKVGIHYISKVLILNLKKKNGKNRHLFLRSFIMPSVQSSGPPDRSAIPRKTFTNVANFNICLLFTFRTTNSAVFFESSILNY
jgi:hypothetical protein